MVIFLKLQICKEPTCKKKFTNNGRNAQDKKDFCCSSCACKFGNREYQKVKYFRKKYPDVLSIFLQRTYSKKESRLIICFILDRARLSKMDRTLLLTELIAKNEDGGFT